VALTPAVIQMLNGADDLSIQIIKREWLSLKFIGLLPIVIFNQNLTVLADG
jgi:uncharacterized membrane protein YobD (UPF0266 family)